MHFTSDSLMGAAVGAVLGVMGGFCSPSALSKAPTEVVPIAAPTAASALVPHPGAAALAYAPVPIAVYDVDLRDPEGLRLAWASPAAEEALGLRCKDTLGGGVGWLATELFPALEPPEARVFLRIYQGVALAQEPQHLGEVAYGDDCAPSRSYALTIVPAGPERAAAVFIPLAEGPDSPGDVFHVSNKAQDAAVRSVVEGVLRSARSGSGG